MTQEEKKILLKDLCARLPYGVKCYYNCVIPMDRRELRKGNCMDVLKGIMPMFNGHIGFMVGIDKIDALEGDIKPYLRPMSSMTEKEKAAFNNVLKSCNNKVFACPDKERRYNFFDAEQEDFMNAHHFDYRGLIEKGLAIEAPEGMYEI